MQVLMVISQFYPIVGGAEKQAQLLAKKLLERGIGISVVTGWWILGTPRKETINGVRVHRSFALWRMFGIRGVRFLGSLAHMLSLGIYLMIHGHAYDLIHVHQVLYPAFVSALVGKGILRKPVLAKNACSGAFGDIRQMRRFPLGNLQLRYLVKKIDRLVTVNKEGAREFEAIGYPGNRIVSIPNGVKIPVEGKSGYESVKIVLTAVRLDEQKGIDVLLRAWAELMDQVGGIKLIILGKGPLESSLKKLAESLRIAHLVEFAGVVRNVDDYLKEADLFVLPSRGEGLSNALLEAMGYGLPCIATAVGGNQELFQWEGKEISQGHYVVAKNGLLVNPNDVEGLSRGLIDLIQDQAMREKLGRNGRLTVQEKFSIDRVAEQYLELYRCLLEGRS